MIDEQSSASGHDYASDRSAIGAGITVQDKHPEMGGGGWSCGTSVYMVSPGGSAFYNF